MKCYLYFNIYDYIFWGKNIVFPGAPIAYVLVKSGTGPNQTIYTFIPVCANIDMKKINYVFRYLA